MGSYRQRQLEILKALENNNSVRVDELSLLLQVSESTIRRDLDKLDERGLIERIHGGAIIGEKPPPEPPVFQRKIENIDEKRRIARATADMIQEGETVFIGSGSTALEVARNIKGRRNLTIITNALTVINELAEEEGISLVTIGGLLRQSELSFIGHLAQLALMELRPQKVIMGIRAISIEAGLTNEYLPEVTTDREIIKSAPEVIIVADHTKFMKVTTGFVAPITSASKIVTDDRVPPEVVEEIRSMGVEVIVV